MKVPPRPLSYLAQARRWAASLLLALVTSGVSAKPLASQALLVDGAADPLAVNRDTVRFTWDSEDRSRGSAQTAYQILVASSPALLRADKPDCWDSGKVQSRKSASVEYAGRPLSGGRRFWWKVRIWDQSGTPGPYGAPALFDTGLGQGEWTAHYIWDGSTNLNNFAYFRKPFSLTNQPGLAKVYVTAHNDYLLFCNGRLLGRGPARSDPYLYGQYNAYDITGLLKRGTNVFSAVVHWHGTWNDSGVNAEPAFLLEARLGDAAGGLSSSIRTDESWKVLADTPFIETNAVYFGGAGGVSNRAAIQFDSRGEPANWKDVDFDDSSWASATVVDRPNYRLFAQLAPLEREQAELRPVSIIATNGAWLVDFGRCIDGWPKLTMHANHAGDVVRVEYFQLKNGRKPAGWDQYTCRGGRETWDADFGRHTSFQVLRLTGYAGELKPSDVRGIWSYCDAEVAGRFHCSSPLLNDIYEMCERSARQNIQQGIISVDANREQSPWTADSWNIGNVLLYNHRNTAMIDKVVHDYAAAQLPDGDFPSCCPAYRRGDYPAPGQAARRIPEWSMYWPMLLWQQYLFSGDEPLLREMAPRLIRFLALLKQSLDPATGLINPPGWRISDYAGGNMPSAGYNAATACQYYEDLSIASRIFAVLAETNQSQEYGHQAAEVKAGINSNLFNGEFYFARTDRKQLFPLASAWALRFDIEPAGTQSKILDTIEKAGEPNLGGYGGDAFYSGLLNAGGGSFVVSDLARYRPMLRENKSNWESWDPRNEVNHAWTAYPGYIFLKYICGIQPTSGGFATFDVRPETGGLSFAEGVVPTVKGLITTRWEKVSNDQFVLSLQVPANTLASVYIPKVASGNMILTESGKQLWPPSSEVKDPGVLHVEEEGTRLKCIVAGGAYRFKETTARGQ